MEPLQTWYLHLVSKFPVQADELRGDDAFSRMYAQHAPRVIAVATSVLNDRAAAEDVAQEVFLSLWRNPGAYDARRGSLGTYLSLLGRSRAIDRLRSEASARNALQKAAAEVEVRQASAPDAADSAFARSRTKAALAALDRLPVPQRQAVVASALGLTSVETAEIAGVPLGTAKSRLRLGLGRAREAFEGSGLQAVPAG